MCGICGELNFNGQPANLSLIEKMMKQLSRRGPDHGGSFSDGALAFGHRRLSIIDLSTKAHQPMIDSNLGLSIVFNGTIYNYKELRTELKKLGYNFFSEGDTEVILKAFHKWGTNCVEKLHGMFAFAIWNHQTQQLFLARDRFGIKPLYYSQQNQKLIFASTLQALVATGEINTQIDPIALHYHLTIHAIPAPHSLLQGIQKLAPASWLLFDRDGNYKKEIYWHLNATRPEKPKTDQEWLDLTRETLKKAVESHEVIADVPVGVLLSGGVDSSLLTAMLANENLLTFSIGFEDTEQEKGNEFDYSDLVAKHCKTRHHRLLIPNKDVLARLPDAVAAMNEPMISHDVVAFYLLSEYVSQHVKVVQGGQGADEVFGGYLYHQKMYQNNAFEPFYFDRNHEEFLETVSPAFHGENYSRQLVEKHLNLPNAEEFIDQVLRFDITTLLVDDPVKRVDNMTMAWGLESRVPFLDHQLVELAAQMPPSFKMKDNGKYPLKALARELLPSQVIDRPKGYFPMPALRYVKGEFEEFMKEILYSETCRNRGLFQRSYIDNLFQNPNARFSPLMSNKLWHLASLELWLQLLYI